MAKNVGSKAAEVVKSMDVDLSRLLGSVGICWIQRKLLPDCCTAAGLPQHTSSSGKES